MTPHHQLCIAIRELLEERDARYHDSILGSVDLYITSQGWSAVLRDGDRIMVVHACSNAGVVSKALHLQRHPEHFNRYSPDEVHIGEPA